METQDFLDFVRLVVEGNLDEAAHRLRVTPDLATMALRHGATRQEATEYFFTEITHYIYAGDTALHMAAAAFSRPMAELLVSHGADVRGEESARSGADPLCSGRAAVAAGGRSDRIPFVCWSGPERCRQVGRSGASQSG